MYTYVTYGMCYQLERIFSYLTKQGSACWFHCDIYQNLLTAIYVKYKSINICEPDLQYLFVAKEINNIRMRKKG